MYMHIGKYMCMYVLFQASVFVRSYVAIRMYTCIHKYLHIYSMYKYIYNYVHVVGFVICPRNCTATTYIHKYPEEQYAHSPQGHNKIPTSYSYKQLCKPSLHFMSMSRFNLISKALNLEPYFLNPNPFIQGSEDRK